MVRALLITTAALFIFSAGCSENSSDMANPAFERNITIGDAPAGRIIKLTPAAVEKLREAQASGGKNYVRVGVEGGGCSGFVYNMKLEDTIDKEADWLVVDDGVQVVVDKRSALFLTGSTIDWQTAPNGDQGFKFDNPNAVKADSQEP